VWDGIEQSVQQLAAGWKTLGRILVAVRFSVPVQTVLTEYTTSCIRSAGYVSRVKSDQGAALTTRTHLGPRIGKSRVTILLHLWSYMACYRVKKVLSLSSFVIMLYHDTKTNLVPFTSIHILIRE